MLPKNSIWSIWDAQADRRPASPLTLMLPKNSTRSIWDAQAGKRPASLLTNLCFQRTPYGASGMLRQAEGQPRLSQTYASKELNMEHLGCSGRQKASLASNRLMLRKNSIWSIWDAQAGRRPASPLTDLCFQRTQYAESGMLRQAEGQPRLLQTYASKELDMENLGCSGRQKASLASYRLMLLKNSIWSIWDAQARAEIHASLYINCLLMQSNL
jgi:hypothetical protein